MLCRGKSSEKQDNTFKQIYSSQSRKQIQDLGVEIILKYIVAYYASANEHFFFCSNQLLFFLINYSI